MQVNSISKINYSNYYKNFSKQTTPTTPVAEPETKELKSIGYTDLVFQARVQGGLFKPKFHTPLQEKIGNKITSYLKNLPEGTKLAKPIIMNVEDNVIEFLMDKTSKSGITQVSIKMSDKDANLSTLNLSIDKKGQVQAGMHYKEGGLTTFFERLSSKIRRMKYGNAFYRPDCGNDILWTRESTHVDRTISPLAKQRMEFKDSELQEMLSELAKVRISFLAE